MAEQYREREDKFEVDAAWELPDLTEVIPAGARIELGTVSLSSKYFDTADHALLARGVTLRLRTGDADTGWQLKVPAGAARTELRVPANGTTRNPPPELRDLLFGLRGGAALRPVATLHTTRSVARVLDSSGQLLAEIADDQVTASVGADAGAATGWREVEVELGVGDEKLLASIGKRLLRTGATRAKTRSKLAHVLGSATPAPARSGPLGDLVAQYLQAQYAALIDGDLALRRDEDAIHRTRVATRRYRSVLRVFADLFDGDRAAALDADLAQYSTLLGEVRDYDVLRARLDHAVASLPPELVVGPVGAQIDEQLRSDRIAAHEALTRHMRSKRYVGLLAELKARHDQPAFTEAASAKAGAVNDYLRRATRATAKRLERAARSGDDEALHRARRAGKRARYVAELAAPVLGKPARRIVKRATKLQDVLGEHNDSIGASDVLLRLATTSTGAGRNGFTYGLLYANEQRIRRATGKRARSLTL